jgi:amino acid transporter
MPQRHGQPGGNGKAVSAKLPGSFVNLFRQIAYLPIPGGHIKLAERFFDPALSFAMGWNYWFNWSIVLPAELSAASVLINFWIKPDRVNNAAWISICLVVTVVINMLGAGMSYN